MPHTFSPHNSGQVCCMNPTVVDCTLPVFNIDHSLKCLSDCRADIPGCGPHPVAVVATTANISDLDNTCSGNVTFLTPSCGVTSICGCQGSVGLSKMAISGLACDAVNCGCFLTNPACGGSGSIQYNNGGNFCGAAYLIYDPSVCSLVLGDRVASGFCSHSQGCSYALGNVSHAEGQSIACGDFSHSEGFCTAARGVASHAEGCCTATCSLGAHSEGYATTATNIGAHAEGFCTCAYGVGAHAEGFCRNYGGFCYCCYSPTHQAATVSTTYCAIPCKPIIYSSICGWVMCGCCGASTQSQGFCVDCNGTLTVHTTCGTPSVYVCGPVASAISCVTGAWSAMTLCGACVGCVCACTKLCVNPYVFYCSSVTPVIACVCAAGCGAHAEGLGTCALCDGGSL